MNDSNLIPNTERSPEELREMGRRGGIASGKSRRKKRELQKLAQMLLDEQIGSSKVANKVLNKVNLVNDWAVRLKEELGRKPTVEEIAENMGVSKEHVMEAIQLSAENIEVKDTKKQN